MADIKLKDIGGEEKTYSGIKHIKVPSSTGEQVEFDLEAAVQEKSVEIIQNGTTEVEPDIGYDGLSKVTITTNVPSSGGETEEVTVDLSMADGNQVITPAAGKSISKATVTKPSTLIPVNIKKDVVIGGVTGTLDSGGGGGVDVSDFGDAAGDGCVIISPDRLSITVYGKREVNDPIGVDNNLAYSLNDGLTPLQPNVLSKLNSWATELMTAGTTANNNFNSIFGTANKALFMNDVRGDCEVPKFLETDTKDWTGLLGALKRSLSNQLANQFSWKSIGYDEYCVSYNNTGSAYTSEKVKYQYCWSVPSSTTEDVVVAYNIKTPTIQMPVYENGTYSSKDGDTSIAAFNANIAGNTSELLFLVSFFNFGAHIYSPNAQTIPSAFWEAIFGQSGIPDMPVQAGWGSISIPDFSYTAETEQALQSTISAKDGMSPEIFLNADEYIRSALLPITGTSYSNNDARRLELTFNLVAETV